MNLVLNRRERRDDGIFGELRTEAGSLVAVTLEHAYLNASGLFQPKIPNGVYFCVRGMHRLQKPTGFEQIETFEITEVPGCTGILFHPGNRNADSSGCVLIGELIAPACPPQPQTITNSRDQFGKLMAMQDLIGQFILTVKG